MINGLDPVQFPPVALIDLDDTVFKHPETFIEGAVERLRELQKTHRLYYFSCGLNQTRHERLQAEGIRFEGAIPKPLACQYVIFDDRLDLPLCSTKL